jgi:hypothetical protein
MLSLLLSTWDTPLVLYDDLDYLQLLTSSSELVLKGTSQVLVLFWVHEGGKHLLL